MTDHRKQEEGLSTKALDRRVRRHVISQEHRFAAIAPPELAPLCQRELAALGLTPSRITEAGAVFRGRLQDCYRANLWLRTASRVLLRLPGFRAGTAEELFYKIGRIPWGLWLNPRVPLKVSSHVERSRIRHEGRVAETVRKAISRNLDEGKLQGAGSRGCTAPEGQGEAADESQLVLVHLVKNHCRLSLDTSGAHLHRRGYRLRHGGAPLRETLAAAVLMKTGWSPSEPLVDGMCGAGTFPVEAALQARGLPPGFGRSFLFEKWPSFQVKTWSHLRRRALEKALDACPAAVIGLDRDSRALEIARENAANAGALGNIQWMCMNFFDFEPFHLHQGPGVLILNPPYGKRLAGDGSLYTRLGEHLKRSFRGWKAAVMAPDKSLLMRLGLRPEHLWRIFHGGAPVFVALARIADRGRFQRIVEEE